MQATAIMPFVSLLALIVGLVFHIEIQQDVQLQLAEVIAGVIAVGYVIKGIIQNHKKTP